MNLIEALKTGKRFRRPDWNNISYSIAQEEDFQLTAEDILAEDWELVNQREQWLWNNPDESPSLDDNDLGLEETTIGDFKFSLQEMLDWCQPIQPIIGYGPDEIRNAIANALWTGRNAVELLRELHESGDIAIIGLSNEQTIQLDRRVDIVLETWDRVTEGQRNTGK
jgi:hypothetical protein